MQTAPLGCDLRGYRRRAQPGRCPDGARCRAVAAFDRRVGDARHV